MIISGIAFAVALACSQEDLDAAIRELAPKISREGLSGKLAEAAASDSGVQAIHEKIDFLLAARISRFERDNFGAFEDRLFTSDDNNDLHLRPERRAEVADLIKRLPLAARAMSDFSRRADDLVRRLGDSEMDKVAKASWSDPVFRAAFFHRHPAELRVLDEAEKLDALGFRGIERQSDGKPCVAGPYAAELTERLHQTVERAGQVKSFEKPYLQLVAKVDDAAARAVLSSDTAAAYLIGRILRQAAEGSGEPIGAVTEADEEAKTPASITFAADLSGFVNEIRDCEASLAALKVSLEERTAGLDPALPANAAVLDFLKNGRARVLFAEQLQDLQESQRRKTDEIMNAVVEDGFMADADKLTVKKGRYLDGDGKESAEALAGELRAVIEEFNGAIRQDFDRIAERCVEPDVIGLFEDRAATYLLLDFRDRVVDGLSHEMRQHGLDTFVKAYLTKQGDAYVVRPDRAGRVEAILKRAFDISQGK